MRRISKYNIPVNLTIHATERLDRFSEVSFKRLERDLQQQVFNMCRERGEDIYKVSGRIAKYIFSVEHREINVITILYKKQLRKDVYKCRQYMPVTKKEIKKIFNLK